MNALYLLKSVRLGDGDVVNAGERFFGNELSHSTTDGFSIANAPCPHFFSQQQSLPEDWSSLALFGTQVRVASAHRQAIGVTYGWHRHDFNWQIEVTHQVLDDCQLLPIFSPEIGACRLDNVEELEHYGRDTGEMAGPGDSLERTGHWTNINAGSKSFRVYLILSWDKNGISTRFTQQRDIAFNVTRVTGQVLIGSKLGWINKYASDNVLVLIVCATDQ